jgi:uncharacterized protein YjdB
MKLKQIISTLIAAILALSLAVSVSAETAFDKAAEIKLNTAYEVTLKHRDGLTQYFYTYKFDVKSKTTITLTLNMDFSDVQVALYDADGNQMGQKNHKASSGQWSTINDPEVFEWNYKTQMGKGSVDYTIQKGTYYLQMSQYYFSGSGGNTMTFKVSDPNAESVTALSLSLSLEEGDEIQLGGIVTPSSAKVTWKSSDSEIATVSSKGLVTAVSSGKATITATAGGKSAKITIIVS